ncbi:OmpA family protein [Thiohalophilus thiocyanatoxydans]|uniref:Uncharacterized protein DUF4398 n=1 Tax=Thiohalophilus thiocyanatoxydans TaxID=381308 RepID=A0A4R8IQF5_9GAMM|nr:OmpA family protein [Thiohalophilus thiocyanatoxydans]TDX99312.1 uncharacterized protein DUF4398 [Thiohalophilus thiocyanatoxydans]
MRRNYIGSNYIVPVLLIVGVALAGCTTVPEQHAVLEEARSNVMAAQSDSDVNEYAATELQEAERALERAENAWNKQEDAEEVDHLAYLANQRALVAHETGRLRAAEITVDNVGERRAEIRLEARTAEADAAKARLREMKKELAELDAKATDRGLIITLSDVLFDVNQASLKSGSERDLQKVVDFLREYPERKVLVEGFTDNTGSASYNQVLSERRANSVRTYFIEKGISSNRVAARGYGESDPVASNATPSSRQLNRRVEIVISEDENDVESR